MCEIQYVTLVFSLFSSSLKAPARAHKGKYKKKHETSHPKARNEKCIIQVPCSRETSRQYCFIRVSEWRISCAFPSAYWRFETQVLHSSRSPWLVCLVGSPLQLPRQHVMPARCGPISQQGTRSLRFQYEIKLLLSS